MILSIVFQIPLNLPLKKGDFSPFYKKGVGEDLVLKEVLW